MSGTRPGAPEPASPPPFAAGRLPEPPQRPKIGPPERPPATPWPLLIKIALTARKGDGALQHAPLRSQAQALGLKARVFISQLLTKQAHHVSRPSKESLAKSATLPGALEHVFHTIICPKQAPGATNQHTNSGLGAGTLATVGHAASEARPGASPTSGEECMKRLSQSQSTTRREAHGRLAMPREGP